MFSAYPSSALPWKPGGPSPLGRKWGTVPPHRPFHPPLSTQQDACVLHGLSPLLPLAYLLAADFTE